MITLTKDQEKLAEDKINEAKLWLMLHSFFIGSTGTMFSYLINYNILTMATNGTNIYYNPIFVLGAKNILSDEDYTKYVEELKKTFPTISVDQIEDITKGLSYSNCSAIIAHEILHIIQESFARQDQRQHEFWNYATDYVNNSIIMSETGMTMGELPKYCLYDKKYDCYSAEEVYNDLLSNADNSNVGVVKIGSLSFKNPDSDDVVDGLPLASYGQHITASDLGMSSDDFNTANTLASIDVTNSLKTLSAAGGNGADGKESFVDKLIKSKLEPTIDWREYLHTLTAGLLKTNYTYKKPSKRSEALRLYTGKRQCILPTMIEGDIITVTIAVDVSYSVDVNTVNMFLAEIKSIANTYEEVKIGVLFFTTIVHSYHEFNITNISEVEDLHDDNRGGTDFRSVWEFLKKENIVPEHLIFLTDGGTCNQNDWGDERYCETTFMLYNANHLTAPFGNTVHITNT